MSKPKCPTPRPPLFSYLLGSGDIAGKKIVDLFAGGGGVSLGIELALGRSPDVAINHDGEAIAMHEHNHPCTRHYQTDVFEVDPREAVGSAGVALLWLSPDCFPAGTLVLTERGYVPIETVRIGERVLTHQLNWKCVTETSSTVRPLMTVRGYGHPGLQVSPEHPFYARDSKNGEPEWAPASTLQKGHYWATPTTFGAECLPVPPIGGRGLALSESLFWLVGQYLSNGWTHLTHERAELVITTDKRKADDLRLQLDQWQRIGARSEENELAWHGRETATAYQFTTSHRGLVEWLRENFGHRAENKTLPGWAYHLPVPERTALLQGYLQGDGYNGATVQECSTVSKALAFSLKSLAESLGKSVTVFLGQNRDHIQGRKVNALPIYQVRWRHQVVHAYAVRDRGLEWAPIREVTVPDGEHTVYNIGVEDDESYVVEGIIVHNCKHHSRAKGGRPLDQKIRSLAWVGLKWAAKVRPDVIVLENVPDFQHWGRLVAQRGAVDENDKAVKLPWLNKPKRKTKATHRRWKRGMPRQKPPRGPVRVDEDGATLLVADKRARYRGKTFRQFKKQLEALGYEVDSRVLRADRYGVPTIRERFFLVARCDGKVISWPEPTHGEGRLPVRTASECIDWNIPTRTIFETHEKRQNDLAENTFTRIAKGLDKYVLGERRPFVVTCNHSGPGFRGQSVDAPLHTITSSSDAHGVVNPFMVQLAHGGHNHRQRDVLAPLGTVTANDQPLVVTPYFTPMSFGNEARPVDAPAQVITTQANKHTLVTPYITKFRQHSIGSDLRSPIDTITAGGGSARAGAASVFGMVTAHLVKHYGGGLAPEHASVSLDRPVGTITTQDHHALVTAQIVQYNGTASAQSLEAPAQTISTVERFGLATAHLTSYYGHKAQDGESRGGEIDTPVRTIPTENRHGLVVTHILRQFGSSDARSVNEPLGSLTAAPKDGLITSHLVPTLTGPLLGMAVRVYRFMQTYCPEALDRLPEEDRAQQLVTLVMDGVKYVIYDIGMRMLEPRELYRCQGFPDSYVIDFSLRGKPLSKAAQVRMCGNSVPPPLVAAIVGAQFEAQIGQAAD
ncbi:hypothetical protein GCM10022631_10590 [Deinococcus rubellus]|uniref:DNA cytosine methyltransferase n=1 Tax=Deinococcus rubellus TaxID=1889240 RepID=UPI0031ED9E17